MFQSLIFKYRLMQQFFKRKIFFTITFSFLISIVFAQETTTMSLDDAIKYALENSNGIKSSKLGIKKVDLQIEENKATALPQLTANAGFSYYFQTPQILFPDYTGVTLYGVLKNENVLNSKSQTIIDNSTHTQPNYVKISFQQPYNASLGASVNQLLYSGTYNEALRALKIGKKYALVQVYSKEVAVRNQVIDAYVPALLINENVKTLNKNISNLNALSKETQATYKAGFAEQLDVDRLTLSLTNLQTAKTNLEQQRDLVINALKLIIGYPIEKNIEPSDNIQTLLLIPTDDELVGAIDFNKRAEYIELSNAEEISKLQIDIAKAAYKPTVNGFLSYSAAFNSSDLRNFNYFPTGVIGISANITLWDWHATRSRVQQAELALQQLQYSKNDLERAITLQVANSRISYRTAQRNVENQQKNVGLAERIYKTTQIKYKSGVGSSFEMSSAESQLYTAQQNLVQSQYDLMVAYRAILKAVGK